MDANTQRWLDLGIPDWMVGYFHAAVEEDLLAWAEIRDAVTGMVEATGCPLTEADAIRVWMALIHPDRDPVHLPRRMDGSAPRVDPENDAAPRGR